MANIKTLDALDINGLAIFKENIVKKYVTNGEAPTVISRAIYKALQQYKKDVVKFYSSYADLPRQGNAGSLYLIHKSVDKEHTDPDAKYANTIWFSISGTSSNIMCEFSSDYTISLSKHYTGYYILNLNDVDPTKVSYLRVYSSTRTTVNLYKPSGTGYINSYADLVALSGKIVAVTNYSNVIDTVIMPRLEYNGSGDIPDYYNVPDDEIWVYDNVNNTMSLSVSGYFSGTLTEKNKYGYFVLKKGVHFPEESNINVYTTRINNSSNLYASTRKYGYFSIEKSDDLHKLCGHIIILAPRSNAYPLFVVYPYDNREQIVHTTEEPFESIPEDEAWFDSTCWPRMFVSFNGANGSFIELTKNTLGYYVLSKSLIDDTNVTSMHLAIRETNNSFGDKSYGAMSEWSGSVIRTLSKASSSALDVVISSASQVYEFLGKAIYVARGYSTPLQVNANFTVDTANIPSSEVWIDGTNFGNNNLYLLQTGSIYSTPQATKTLYKNEYGYYVLYTADVTSDYVLFGSTTSGTRYYYDGILTDTVTNYLKCNNPTQNAWCLNPEYLQNIVNGKIITTAPKAEIVAPMVQLEGSIIKYTYEYIDPPVIEPEDTSDHKFILYAWVNGKYRQLGSSLFDTSDLHLERITDQVLSLTSTNPISNQAFCNALRYKVSIAEILANPAMGYDNPVASSGIKAAIDRLITWEDIDCIPITENEIHTLFTTYDPIALDKANYYRIVIRGLKSEGANYLAKIFDAETLAGLTFVERSPDGPSISETLIFTEDDTGKRISVTVSCANKYNSATMFYPGDLFDANTDGYYRADTSENDLVLTIDIRRRLAMSTLRKLTFRCLAGRPYQTTVPPAEKLYISTYGSVGGVDYPSFRTNVVYTPNRVANDGIYTIPLFPAE